MAITTGAHEKGRVVQTRPLGACGELMRLLLHLYVVRRNLGLKFARIQFYVPLELVQHCLDSYAIGCTDSVALK